MTSEAAYFVWTDDKVEVHEYVVRRACGGIVHTK